MAITFYGKDPTNPGNNCPAVFRDESTGDFFFQGRPLSTQRPWRGSQPTAPSWTRSQWCDSPSA